MPRQINLFLCHTPLHILISLLVAEHISPEEKIIFAIVEDSKNLHDFAQQLVNSRNIELLLLPGAASTQYLLKRALIHRANAKFLHDTYAGIVSAVFIFHDLRAESQKLLNSDRALYGNIRFILLEDGVALYEPGGLLVDGFFSILKRKIFWDIRWKHAPELGHHPKLSEIQCFYPHLLKPSLRHLRAQPLPRIVPEIENSSLPGKLSLLHNNYCIIAVPHYIFGKDFISKFIDYSMRYCASRQLIPVFKLHPRDQEAKSIISTVIDSPAFIPQDIPIELLLFCMPGAVALTGARTSALHIVNALHPNITCLYFDEDDNKGGSRWINFFAMMDIRPLISD